MAEFNLQNTMSQKSTPATISGPMLIIFGMPGRTNLSIVQWFSTLFETTCFCCGDNVSRYCVLSNLTLYAKAYGDFGDSLYQNFLTLDYIC